MIQTLNFSFNIVTTLHPLTKTHFMFFLLFILLIFLVDEIFFPDNSRPYQTEKSLLLKPKS